MSKRFVGKFSRYNLSIRISRGFSLLELILAAAIFVTFATSAIIILISALNSNRLGAEVTIANQFNAEGMEAVRSVANQSFSNLSAASCTQPTSTGVQIVGGVWTLRTPGTNVGDTLASDSRFVREINICSVQRDSNNNIVTSGGTVDTNTYKVTVTTTWNFNSARQDSVILTSYLTNWKSKKTGMLVYGNGGTTSNAVVYQMYNSATDSWSAAASTASVGQSATAALRAVRVYSSSTRNEKIAISRHYQTSNTSQAIYAQVYNGTSWGNVVQLSSWTASTFLDVRNFDGAYLSNGDFMAVYSDNTSTPKYAIWNGSSWTTGSLVNLANNGSGIPVYVVAKARPGTNEVMAVFFGQAKDTNTEYFNGGSYTTANWTLHARHATNAPVNTKEYIDFAWSPNSPTKGALNYLTSTSDKKMNLKVFTADGSGGGSWSGTVNTPTSQGTLGPLNIDARAGANDFISCDKDGNNDIYCFKANTTPTWGTAAPANNILTTSTDTGIERSFDVNYVAASGSLAVVVYSDTTKIPKLRKYDPTVGTSGSFDASATSLSTLNGNLTVVKMVPNPSSDDIMILLGDSTNRTYTVVWNGTTNAVYASGGKAFTAHGTNGSASIELWFGFAWDKF